MSTPLYSSSFPDTTNTLTTENNSLTGSQTDYLKFEHSRYAHAPLSPDGNPSSISSVQMPHDAVSRNGSGYQSSVLPALTRLRRAKTVDCQSTLPLTWRTIYPIEKCELVFSSVNIGTRSIIHYGLNEVSNPSESSLRSVM